MHSEKHSNPMDEDLKQAGSEEMPPVLGKKPLPPIMPEGSLPPASQTTDRGQTGVPVHSQQQPFEQNEIQPGLWSTLKKHLMVVLGVVFLGFKFLGKLKFLVLPVVKYGATALKTGGTMFVTIWAYAMAWGWAFAAGFVLLIFVHECGHLIAARRCGLNAGAPVFIPFMGAFIALKDAPKNAWIEAIVGIGGPLLGTVGAFVCQAIYMATGQEMYRALAYSGFFLNLFNMVPIGFLDGGRIATALSPWLWIAGLVIMIGFLVLHFNFLILLVLLLSAPRVFSLFRDKSDEEKRYFEISAGQRWTMALLYFGLLALLAWGMKLSYFKPIR